MARHDFDPATVTPDGRPLARSRLFDPATDGPWRGSLEGLATGSGVTVLAYGTDTVGAGPGLHVHPYDETFLVVQGRARGRPARSCRLQCRNQLCRRTSSSSTSVNAARSARSRSASSGTSVLMSSTPRSM